MPATSEAIQALVEIQNRPNGQRQRNRRCIEIGGPRWFRSCTNDMESEPMRENADATDRREVCNEDQITEVFIHFWQISSPALLCLAAPAPSPMLLG